MFVHGLNGHPEDSWSSKSGFFWPKHPLSDSVSYRILTFGYVADVTADGHSLLAMREYSTLLSASLLNHRQADLITRPLFFVCHDVGGLIVKQMLIKCSSKPSNTLHSALLRSTKAIAFFGTPHRGIKSLEKLLTSFVDKLRNSLTGDLNRLTAAVKPGASELFAINDDFAGIATNITILSFYEVPTPGSTGEPFIDRESALLHVENEEAICLPRTHRDLVRFDGADSDVYRLVQESVSRTFGAEIKPVSNPQVMIPFHQRFLQRLSQRSAQKRVDKISDPNERTFAWAWAKDFQLEKWRLCQRSLCWISGKPGSGKSTLMRKIFMDLKKTYLQSNTSVVGFFFSGLGEKLERSFEGLLRAILEDFLRHRPQSFPVVLENFPEIADDSLGEDRLLEFGVDRLKRTVLDLLSRDNSSFKLVLCVDALDECIDAPMRTVVDFFRKCVSTKNKVPVRVCLSGRALAPLFPNPEIATYGFTIEDHTEDDIYFFVEDEISAFASQEPDGVEWESLREKIALKAGGIFFWAELVCRKLSNAYERGDNIAELVGSLRAIPPELGGIFKTMLGTVDPASVHETNTMLALTITAQRPLSVEELCFAMAFGGDKVFQSQQAMRSDPLIVHSAPIMVRRLRHRCVGLLEVVHVTNSANHTNALTSESTTTKMVVQLIHPSVKDFLLMPTGHDINGLMTGDDLVTLGHQTLARACMRYLVISEIRNSGLEKPSAVSTAEYAERIGDEYPFISYATEAGFWHYGWCESRGSAEVQELERLEINDGQGYKTWKRLILVLSHVLDDSDMVTEGLNSPASLLEKATQSGYVDFAKRKFGPGSTRDRISYEDLDLWLHQAIQSNSIEMVKLLLGQGADPNAPSKGLLPLQRAVLNGREDMVRILLGFDASPLQSGHFGSLWSALAPSNELKLMDRLSRDHDRMRNPSRVLHWWNTVLNLSRWLESAEEEVTVCSGIISTVFGTNPEATMEAEYLDRMAELLGRCPADIQRTMLDRDPTFVERRSSGEETALHFLSAWGSPGAVQMLIEYGADVHAEMADGCNALFCAVFNDSAEVLEYLLKMQVDPNTVSNAGQIALHQAAMYASREHVLALIGAGSDLSLTDRRNTTMCHFAMLNPAVSDIFTPLRCSNTVNSADSNGNTPLHWAAAHSTLINVEIALANGADIEATNRDGMSVLHFAARNCRSEAINIFDMLLAKTGNIDAVDDLGQTPLHHVFRTLEEDTAPDFRHLIVSYPVIVFDPKSARHMIDCIIDHGANVNITDSCGNTPLHHACWRNSLSAVSRLLLAGADAKCRNQDGNLPVDLTMDEKIRQIIYDTMNESETPDSQDTLRELADMPMLGLESSPAEFLKDMYQLILRAPDGTWDEDEFLKSVQEPGKLHDSQSLRDLRVRIDFLTETRSLVVKKQLGSNPLGRTMRMFLADTFVELYT